MQRWMKQLCVYREKQLASLKTCKLLSKKICALLHTISGQNQVDDHLPEIVFFCAVIPAAWNFVKGHNAVFFIQPCLEKISVPR